MTFDQNSRKAKVAVPVAGKSEKVSEANVAAAPAVE